MLSVLRGVALTAAMSGSATGFRVHHEKKASATLFSGVPVHNYDLRFMQVRGPGPEGFSLELDWVLALKKEHWTQQQLDDLYQSDSSSLVAVGQPTKGGLAYVTLRSTEEAMKEFLAAHPSGVEFVEPDLPVYVIPEIDEPKSRSVPEGVVWGHETINLDQASHSGKGVHVFVMDTGVRTTHEDFGGRAVPTVDTILGEGSLVVCDPGDADCSKDSHGHGTHVAGTVGGWKYGVAKESTLHSMRVCCGTGTNTFVAMDWIMTSGQRPGVMTMSLGSWGQSAAAKLAVNGVVEAGVTVLVSAGNNDVDACEKTYAYIPSAIAIGSTTVDNERSWFSNWGTCVALYAPGSDVVSAGHRSDDGVATMSGTSMATPMAAGVTALLVEEFPSYNPMEIREELIGRATVGALTKLYRSDENLLLSVVAA